MTEPAKRMDLAAYAAAVNERIEQLIQYQKESSSSRNLTAQPTDNAQRPRKEVFNQLIRRIQSS
jgi:hypothetical protein